MRHMFAWPLVSLFVACVAYRGGQQKPLNARSARVAPLGAGERAPSRDRASGSAAAVANKSHMLLGGAFWSSFHRPRRDKVVALKPVESDSEPDEPGRAGSAAAKDGKKDEPQEVVRPCGANFPCSAEWVPTADRPAYGPDLSTFVVACGCVGSMRYGPTSLRQCRFTRMKGGVLKNMYMAMELKRTFDDNSLFFMDPAVAPGDEKTVKSFWSDDDDHGAKRDVVQFGSLRCSRSDTQPRLDLDFVGDFYETGSRPLSRWSFSMQPRELSENSTRASLRAFSDEQHRVDSKSKTRPRAVQAWA
eukprot:TRINITY_DN64038_c0_g1_i1.p1 TRINITY_DN64038_c0_g1~~TRINITY_DN64038_c0_g1_i1.p1  ORF type:complete len:303 (-),score=24.57 TRINITY_DN64038_c0_g1_i1:290-1198(-)